MTTGFARGFDGLKIQKKVVGFQDFFVAPGKVRAMAEGVDLVGIPV